MPRCAREHVRQSLKAKIPQLLQLSPLRTMASAANAKEPLNEQDKDIWKKSEQQFTSYDCRPYCLPHKGTNCITGSEAQSSLTPVKISPTRASNVCAEIIVTRRCVKTTSSTILCSNTPSAPRTSLPGLLGWPLTPACASSNQEWY
jgi:hypothetical protein